MKPRIVLSGVNFIEGGPLAVFKDALETLARHFADQYEIVALVHSRALFGTPGVRYMEFPDVKASWLWRLRFEYVECRALSRELDAHLWLAMHDMTPRVTARVRAVYCHNPAPFYSLTMRDVWLDPRFALFRYLYALLYRINIDQNDAVIVQQEWMRREFRERYPLRQVVVAHPSLPENALTVGNAEALRKPRIFFYPALARCFKNAEVLLEAAAELSRSGASSFEVWLTIDGSENRYAAWLRKKFADLACVRWMGTMSRQRVEELYAEADCLVFPSKLETWGMPLSEFKPTGKQMLAADLPYAHETIGDCDNVRFFPAEQPAELAALMRLFLSGELRSEATTAAPIAAPFAPGWRELFDHLLRVRGEKAPGSRRKGEQA